MRAEAGVKDFRFHDYRHDFGTKLLRETGNLKLVQKALNHRDIKSTLRYAHVLDADVASAVEAVAKSRKKSQTAANALIVFLDCISGDKLSKLVGSKFPVSIPLRPPEPLVPGLNRRDHEVANAWEVFATRRGNRVRLCGQAM
jgi:hypothetical protein